MKISSKLKGVLEDLEELGILENSDCETIAKEIIKKMDLRNRTDQEVSEVIIGLVLLKDEVSNLILRISYSTPFNRPLQLRVLLVLGNVVIRRGLFPTGGLTFINKRSILNFLRDKDLGDCPLFFRVLEKMEEKQFN